MSTLVLGMTQRLGILLEICHDKHNVLLCVLTLLYPAALCWIVKNTADKDNPDCICLLPHFILTIMFFLSCCIFHHEQGKVYLNDYYLKSFVKLLFCICFMCTYICSNSLTHSSCINFLKYECDLIHLISPTGILLMWLETTWPKFSSVMFSAATHLPRT